MAAEAPIVLGSPRWTRSGNVSTANQSFFWDIEITSYADFVELLSLDDGSDTKCYVEADHTGALSLGFPTGNTIWTDGYTGRFRMVLTLNPNSGSSLAKIWYRRLPTGAIVAGPSVATTTTTPNRTAYCANPLFLTDMNGTLRFHTLMQADDIWGMGEVQYLLANGVSTGRESRKYRASYFNDFSRADLVHLDQSGRGSDFTLTGTLNPLPATADPYLLEIIEGPSSVAATDITLAITGNSGTASAGSVTPSETLAITGNAATAGIGTVAPVPLLALSGTSATASPGTMVPSNTTPLSGASVTASAGTPVATATLPITGTTANSAAGTVLVGSDLSVALTGTAMTASAGTVLPVSTLPVTGNGLITNIGSLTPALTKGITGSAGTTSTGAITPASTVPITGNGLTATAGTLHRAGSYAFAAHSSGRYLTYNGNPFLMMGDTAYGAIQKLSVANATTYLNSRQASGFNTVFFALLARWTAFSVGTADALGNQPWTQNASGGAYTGTIGTANLAFPNDAYFTYAKQIIDLAEARNFLIVCYIFPFGFGGDGTEGLYPELTLSVNTTTVCNNLGQYIANGHGTFSGFKSNQNILWVVGSDYGQVSSPPPTSAAESRALAILQGMQTAGALQLVTGDWQAPSISTDEPAFTDVIQMQGTYSYGGVSGDPLQSGVPHTYQEARIGYNYTPVSATQSQLGTTPSHLPNFLKETTYEWSPNHPGTPKDVRKAQWWAYLSGCTAGIIYGDERIWPFANGTWQSAMTDTSAADMARMISFVTPLPWTLFVPSELSGMRRLIPSANGTQSGVPDQYVAAAQASDGSVLLAYVPSSGGTGTQTFTVDLRSMAGSSRARWWDPTGGTFTAIGTGFANTLSAQSFTTPGANAAGDNDWILILDVAALAGNSSTASAGTATPSTTVAITGSAVATTTGTVAPAMATPITGNGLTASAGTVAPAMVQPATGNLATGGIGSVTPSVTVSITGSGMTAATGNVGVSQPGTSGLTGSAASAGAGDIGPNISIPLLGIGMTATAGATAPVIAPAATGISMATGIGTVTSSGGTDAGPEPTPAVEGPIFARSMLAQFDHNVGTLVIANPTARHLKRSAYRLTMDKEPDSAVDGVYFIDLQDARPKLRMFGIGDTIWVGMVSVQVGFHRGGGDAGGRGFGAKGGDRWTVLYSASTDCSKIADVCENPDNYNAETSGIRRVSFQGFRRLYDLQRFEVWQVNFEVEWQSHVITE